MNDLAGLLVTDGGEGRYVIVDAHRFPELNQSTWAWWENDKGRVSVIANSGPYKGKRLTTVVNRTPDDLETDHVNGDPRDCREKNLRIADRSHNMANRGKPKTRDPSSTKKGVCWSRWHNGWRTCIMKDYRTVQLGVYATENDAGYAYNVAAQAIFKDYAGGLNEVDPDMTDSQKGYIMNKVMRILKDKFEESFLKEPSPRFHAKGTNQVNINSDERSRYE